MLRLRDAKLFFVNQKRFGTPAAKQAAAIGRNFAETDAGLRRPREKSEEEEEDWRRTNCGGVDCDSQSVNEKKHHGMGFVCHFENEQPIPFPTLLLTGPKMAYRFSQSHLNFLH